MAYFVTGATGFIGRRLVERLLERKGKIHVLVREDSLGRLDELIEHWETVSEATVSRRIHAVVGDLRQPLLGLSDEQVTELEGTIVHFFHLAAVYDMTAPAELDMAVNVGGTTHAVELAATPLVWNNIAYQLSLKKAHLDRAQQYAESAVSATAAALPSLRRRMLETTLGVDVLGVVRPEASQAVATTRSGRIGLLATPTTVASGAYDEAVRAIDPHVSLRSVSCPGLAAIIQAGEQFNEGTVKLVREACEPLRDADVDTVILGCTHYPLIRPMLQRMLGPHVTLVSSGAALARQVEHALSTRSLGNPREGEGDYRFFCTGDAAAFEQLGTRFLQMPLGKVERVELSETEVAA